MTYAYLAVMAGLVLAILRIIPSPTEVRAAPIGAPASMPVVASFIATPPAPPEVRQVVEDVLWVETARMLESFDDLPASISREPYDDAEFWGPYLLAMDDAHARLNVFSSGVHFTLLDDNNYARIKRYESACRRR